MAAAPAAGRRADHWRDFAEHARSHCDWPRRSTGNSVLDQRRRETLRAIQEEADAYTDFERRQHELRDREAFDCFMADRNAAEGSQARRAQSARRGFNARRRPPRRAFLRAARRAIVPAPRRTPAICR